MKKPSIVVALLFSLLALQAQNGIQFASGSWKELLQEAKRQDKLIFLDAYTSWCGPCKIMSAKVFTERAVGDFYNERFINAKIDMEHGEGLELARRYKIQAFPTLLFIDGNGVAQHRAVGFQSVPKFLELGRIALDPERRLGSFEQRYAMGERGPDFLYQYALASLHALDGQKQELAEAYLQTQQDWSTEKNLRFIFQFVDNTESKLFDYLAANRTQFEEVMGSQEVINRIQNLIMEEAFQGEEKGRAEAKSLERVDALFAKTYPEVAGQLSGLFRMNYYQYIGDPDKYAEATVQYFNRFPPDDPAELNNAAWNFYENVDDPKMLNEALKWALRSVELDSQYYNNDTLAALYAKLGQRKKAIRAARQAIELAQTAQEDYSATQSLLDELLKER